MSTASLSINSPIIGISFERMNAAKKRISRAREEAQTERDSVSRAISSLQVEDGRLRQRAEALNSLRSRMNRQISDQQRMEVHLDHVVQRFKETDNLCAQRIKTGGYAVRKSVGLGSGGGIFGNVIGGLVSVVSKGITAWKDTNKLIADGIKYVFRNEIAAAKYAAKAIGDFYEKHKVVINNIAAIALEAGAIALTVAGVAALSLTGVGLVVAVGIAAAGIAYSASNIVDSGVKLYNYCTTGEEVGFNPLEKGFQAALGDELGTKAYNITGIGIAVADIILGAGLIKAGRQAIKAAKAGELLDEAGDIAKTIGKAEAAELAKQKGSRFSRYVMPEVRSFEDNIDSVLKKLDVDKEYFNSLRMERTELLSEMERKVVRDVRNAVPPIEEGVLVQKVIPQSAIEAYQNGSQAWAKSIRGCVTKAEDTMALDNYKSIFDNLRLDYPGTRFGELDDACGVLRFPAKDGGWFKTPFNPDMGGSAMASQPFTGNGFTKSIEKIVPEFEMVEQAIPRGTELYKVTKDGVEEFMGVYNGVKFILP